ncbi:zonular occludens toxin domain-containing protein [Thiobacillus sp.]|uniref:zonular occludens toxin domain-containing protein n=1 Tax=Thiobacillus sp. TaxID=924 RepID=UPI001AC4D261|nr:zonular occludens toxin domain-containing protein [Thiobacillus sp.]MBN8781352.1 hypothetical protein [Thiobacillus sp.]
MSGVYIITGKLGAGKSLVAVGRIYDYLQRGCPVATNLDLYFRYLADKPGSMASALRLPDHPTIDDMKVIGSGNDTYDEDKNGLIVLDEGGTWFNSRGWADKTRQALIDWLLHSRKLGWDVIILVQDITLIDKQVQTALAEHVVYCRRMDKVTVPVLGKLSRWFGFKPMTFPKMHLGIVKYGTSLHSLVVDKWWYMGKRFYRAYDTKQIFSASYSDGVYCFLPRAYYNEPQPINYGRLMPKLVLYAFGLAMERMHLLERPQWVNV